ncbi:MAG: Crp/Fnr family transcriptional regulator [Dongiaceae bacterium]
MQWYLDPADGAGSYLISRNRFLVALHPEDLRRIEPHLEEVRLDSGAILVDADEPITHAYFPHDAMVSLVSVMEDGSTAETATIGREGLTGFGGLLDRDTAFNRHVVQVPGQAARIEFMKMRHAIQGSGNLRHVLSCYTQALFAQTLQSVACNGLHSLEARCSRWLLMTHDRVGKDHFALTQEFLAEMLGVHRSTVTVTAQMLQQRGAIRYRRGVVSILDRRELENTACECYRTVRRAFERLLPLTFA